MFHDASEHRDQPLVCLSAAPLAYASKAHAMEAAGYHSHMSHAKHKRKTMAKRGRICMFQGTARREFPADLNIFSCSLLSRSGAKKGIKPAPKEQNHKGRKSRLEGRQI